MDTPSPPGIELDYRIKAISDRRTSRVVEAEGNPELLRETWGFWMSSEVSAGSGNEAPRGADLEGNQGSN